MFNKFFLISGSGLTLKEQEYTTESADTIDAAVAGPSVKR